MKNQIKKKQWIKPENQVLVVNGAKFDPKSTDGYYSAS
jgi:hypothetical protein